MASRLKYISCTCHNPTLSCTQGFSLAPHHFSRSLTHKLFVAYPTTPHHAGVLRLSVICPNLRHRLILRASAPSNLSDPVSIAPHRHCCPCRPACQSVLHGPRRVLARWHRRRLSAGLGHLRLPAPQGRVIVFRFRHRRVHRPRRHCRHRPVTRYGTYGSSPEPVPARCRPRHISSLAGRPTSGQPRCSLVQLHHKQFCQVHGEHSGTVAVH
jgi:hypothetical protein